MSVVVDRAVSRGTEQRVAAPWRVMAWKELRENARWAALGLIGLSLALCYAGANALQEYPTEAAVMRFWQTVGTTMALGAPAIALLLALLQTVPEQRRDLAAYVLHRPAPRAALYWGKVAAGLALYTLITVIPLAVGALWARVPGHLAAPFVWGLTVAGFTSILAGVPFYFTGLLAALRPARWYGSRALPVAGALVAAAPLDANVFLSVWPAVIVTLLCTALFAQAARAAYVTLGTFDGASRGARASLAVAQLLGSAVAISMGCNLAAFLIGLLPTPRPSLASVFTGPPASEYRVLTDGELVSLTRQPRLPEEVKSWLSPVRDARGKPETKIALKEQEWGDQPFLMLPGFDRYAGERFFRNADSYIYAAQLSQGGYFGESWYWAPDSRQFTVYPVNKPEAPRVIGPNGIAPLDEAQRVGRFADPLLHLTVMATGEIVFISGGDAYHLAPARNEVRRIALPFPVRDVESIMPLSRGKVEPNGTMDLSIRDMNAPASVIATRRQFAVVSHRGDVLFTIDREFDAGRYPEVSVLGVHDTGDVQFWYLPKRSPNRIFQVSLWSGKGRRIAAYPLPELPDPYATMSTPDFPMPWSDVFIPAAAAMAQWRWLASDRPYLSELGHVADQLPNLDDRRGVTLIMLGGLLSAVAGFLIASRRMLRPAECAFWTFALIWLGIPGVLMLLSMEGFPILMACATCGRKRPVTQETCEQCGTSFAGPSTDGTEIFGDALAFGANAPRALSLSSEELTR